MSKKERPGIFEGVTVLSLAEQLPGPYATLLMADLGADVILVERPSGGDPARMFPPFFRSISRNKRSVCLDLKTEQGRTQFLDLTREADVVFEGFRPGTMDRLGIGYEALREVNPLIIFASISGFGQDGPYRDRPAHDLSYQAIAGHLFNQIGVDPVALPAVPYGDLVSAVFAAFSVSGALFARERTGHGTAIDISMTDTLVSILTLYLGPAMNGASTFWAFAEPAYGAFVASDGASLTLSIAHEDHFWSRLCAVLDMNDACELKAEQRQARCDELRARIAAAIATRPRSDWQDIFDKNSIPWSPFNDLAGVIQDPHFRARGLFSALTAPGATPGTSHGAGEEWHVNQPIKFSAYGSGVRRAAPELGEHSSELLGEKKATSARA